MIYIYILMVNYLGKYTYLVWGSWWSRRRPLLNKSPGKMEQHQLSLAGHICVANASKLKKKVFNQLIKFWMSKKSKWYYATHCSKMATEKVCHGIYRFEWKFNFYLYQSSGQAWQVLCHDVQPILQVHQAWHHQRECQL